MYDRRKFANELFCAEDAMNREFDLLYMGHKMRRMLEHSSQELMQASGLRYVELEILFYLSYSGANDTARDISEAKHLSKAHISKSVDNLRRTGCITLAEDPSDRRCLHLGLTEKGRGLAARYETVMCGTVDRMMSGVTPEERDGMQRVLTKIRRNLDEAMDGHECQTSQTEEKP